MRCLGIALAATFAALGADLDGIRATQQKLIDARDSKKLPRDEVPLDAVTLAKQQLLFWAETRLQAFGRNVDPAGLTKLLSHELEGAIKPAPSDDQDRLGELGLGFSRPNGEPTWLQMNTDVGVPCGFDRSIYLYEWRENRWNRRFALETRDYRRAAYSPQEVVELRLSPADARGSRLILTTGWPPACMSVWHTLFIRLFRVDTTQTLLLAQTPPANLGEDPAYSARLEPAGALVEFAGSSIDADILIRKHVLHYEVDRDKVRRIEPIALSPQDFVDEWLTRPWSEMAAWSDPQLASWHKKLHKDFVSGEYNAAQRCARPGQWQVSIDFDGQVSYFSLIERGNYRFRMLGISDGPQPDCSGQNELLRLGDPNLTLFPKN